MRHKDFGDEMSEQNDLHFEEFDSPNLQPCRIILNNGTEIKGECEWVEPYQEGNRLECIHVFYLDGTRIPSSEYKRIIVEGVQ